VRPALTAARTDVGWNTPRVPWKPPFTDLVEVDHRLDPYRNRGASVGDTDRRVMRVYVQVDSLSTQRSGCLWWRVWSTPREFIVLHMLMEDGTYDDAWLWGTPLDEELLDWSQGIFRHQGRALPLRWLDAEQSATLQRESGLGEEEKPEPH